VCGGETLEQKLMPHVRKPTFDRRAVLWGAARGAKLLAAGGILSAAPFLRLAAQSRIATPASEPLVSPQEIRSRDGVLQATLTAAAGPVRLGAHPFSGFLYNGAYLPPLLRVQHGDTVRVTFRNALPNKPSNLHYHGMSVSPRGNSDNVFVHVHPGETFQYEVRIPPAGRQGPGLYWYHPHAHGYVDDQILGGMSGALVVDGFERLYPLLRGLPERYLLIKHAQIDGGEVVSINGQINPLIAMRPGEMQFWRIAHIGASLFLKFRIEGMALYVVGTDGHPLSQPRKVSEFFIGPGERIEAIAVGPPPGEYAMRTISFQNEAWRPPEAVRDMALIVSSSPAAPTATVEDEILRQRLEGARWIDEVRAAPIAHRRTLVYSRTPDRQVFMIDGRTVDEDRIDQTVKARRHRGMDDRQYRPAISQLSHPSDAVSRNRDRRHAAKRRQLARHRGGAAGNRPRSRYIESGHPLHRSGDRWAIRLSLPLGQSRGQGHDGRHRGCRIKLAARNRRSETALRSKSPTYCRHHPRRSPARLRP
jgi:FtsP/CotA-like multicopper oxidase with cupredoxin domain